MSRTDQFVFKRSLSSWCSCTDSFFRSLLWPPSKAKLAPTS
ncbi:hypothetical protein MJO29_011395 [Puccinia striiformis f. sp. tritici]|nr:hypothetical protein MJO29_011395 [Puccinia striiformis f. sp. tritici]